MYVCIYIYIYIHIYIGAAAALFREWSDIPADNAGTVKSTPQGSPPEDGCDITLHYITLHYIVLG